MGIDRVGVGSTLIGMICSCKSKVTLLLLQPSSSSFREQDNKPAAAMAHSVGAMGRRPDAGLSLF